MYGGTIAFTFQGKQRFTSTVGGLCSVVSGLMFLLYFLLRTGDFLLKIDPLVTMTTLRQEKFESIDLYEHGYRFAI